MVTTTEGRESVRVSHRFLVPRLSLMMFMQFFYLGQLVGDPGAGDDPL
ncbi:Nucleoside permease NupG [Klebsiella pneumoniae]|nr:Nucleoside permease NupG [Klebsiella pneumoniae]